MKPGPEPATGFPVGAAPVPTPPRARAGQGAVWSSGLCDCGDDLELCCVTCWCPCITFGKVAEIVDRGSTPCVSAGSMYVVMALLTGWTCQWIYSCIYRAKLRAQYDLPDQPCCDCCVNFCCEPCALCQEYRELKAQGFDPEIGWRLNVERRNAGVVRRAPGMQPMAR